MIKAAIFDFNGTLINDDDLNYKSWKKTYEMILGTEEGFKDVVNEILSVKNDINIKKLFAMKGIEADRQMMDEWSHQKETFYHEITLEEKRDQLIEGAEELLNYLKENNIPVMMATASIKYNVDFYFDVYKLDKWFNKDTIVYDDLSYADKKEMYLEALRRLNLSGEDVILFDDSHHSLTNGIKAGIKTVVRLNPMHKPKMANPEIKQEISNFKELDYSIFK
ncbi:MAG: HAD family phosphatase [Erysipelotrichaceae bacterium]|nr:HAD family phosphatase [Erysipelotrichaceae bacterium]